MITTSTIWTATPWDSLKARTCKLSGEYVAELYEDMIVETYANYGDIRSAKNPGRLSVPRHPGTRGIINYGYPDASAKLFR